MMWSGEIAHLALGPQVPFSVHFDAANIDRWLECADVHAQGFEVILLSTGSFGGPCDDICEWRVGETVEVVDGGKGHSWFALDWTFSPTYGSRRTLSCLVRFDGVSLSILLPTDTTAERPIPVSNKKMMAARQQRGLLMQLERGDKAKIVVSTARLGTSIYLAVKVRDIIKCICSTLHSTDAISSSRRDPLVYSPFLVI